MNVMETNRMSIKTKTQQWSCRYPFLLEFADSLRKFKAKLYKLTKISKGDITSQHILKKIFGYFPVISLTLEESLLAP